MERSAFLSAVRARLAGVPPSALPAALPRTMVSGDGRLFERFAAELGSVGGHARRVRPDEVPEAVAAFADGCGRAVVAPDVDRRGSVQEALAGAGCELSNPDREGVAAADLGVTRAVLGVASTGSVLLAPGPGSPRTTGLLPERHVVILPEERLVGGFEELFDALPGLAARSSGPVLVTGPSRTSDIEMTLVRGVHGPERVMVLVVTG